MAIHETVNSIFLPTLTSEKKKRRHWKKLGSEELYRVQVVAFVKLIWHAMSFDDCFFITCKKYQLSRPMFLSRAVSRNTKCITWFGINVNLHRQATWNTRNGATSYITKNFNDWQFLTQASVWLFYIDGSNLLVFLMKSLHNLYYHIRHDHDDFMIYL